MHQTLTEILSQPEVWQQVLEQTVPHYSRPFRALLRGVDQVLFTGCGSTYYLALAAASLFQALTPYPARGIPGSELAFNAETVLDGRPTLLVAVSRSGATDETLRAVERFRQTQQGPVLAITTNGDQPLAAMGDECVILEAAQEQSVVQTRSFTAMYMAAVALAVLARGEEGLASQMQRLPEIGKQVMESSHEPAESLGSRLEKTQFFFLGSGVLYGLACEGSLKLTEMSLTVSEPFHFLEFRHGPMSMVDEQTVLVGLLSQKNRQQEEAVLQEMARLGGTVFTLGEEDVDVAFHSGLPEPLRGVLYLPPLQLLGYYRATARGLDPDHPRYLSSVVHLDPTE